MNKKRERNGKYSDGINRKGEREGMGV